MAEKPTYEELEQRIQELEQAESERKQTENSLEYSESNLKRAQTVSKVGSWYYDWDSETEIWSDECFNLYNINKDDYPDNIIPESVSEGVYANPEEVQKFSTFSAEKYDTYELEFITVPINGQEKTIYSYCEVEKDNDGNILKVFGTDQDITQGRERIDLSLKGTSLGLWDWDVASGRVILNVRALSYIKPTPKNYKNWLDLIHSDDLNKVKENEDALVLGKIDALNYEYRIMTEIDKFRWMNCRGRVVEWNSAGSAKRVTGIIRDVTEQKESTAALSESQKRTELALKGADLGMWDYNVLTDEWIYDEYCIKLMGSYPRNDAELDALIHHDDLHQYDETWNAFMEEREAFFICEYRVKNLSGGYKWLKDRGKIVERDSNGKPIRISGIVKNITKRKQAEGEKAKLEFQLQQSQKMESIGTLAGGIAHDFNNILFPIVGHAEMLLEDVPEDSPFQDGLNQIYTGALRASELVKQILTFSRQENGELKLMKMQPIIKEALKLVRSTIPTTIEIKQNLQFDCGPIKADPTQIHQIVMNLATNAYHAMEETGGELKIRLNQVELGKNDLFDSDLIPGVYACLTVADTGVGMDKNLQEKIFDPFFTTKEKGKGTGMGLSVAHGIVKNMHGAIKISSELNKGTQFHVYLPIAEAAIKQQVTDKTTVIQGGTERILLVDDEKTIIEMEQNMLERLGYKVTSRSSSLEALEAFRAAPHKFDMVITDMAMPNMPGDKLSVELTKIRPDIPILLCTGFSETMSEEKAEFLGINGFLLKPIVMKDLSHKIREVLDTLSPI